MIVLPYCYSRFYSVISDFVSSVTALCSPLHCDWFMNTFNFKLCTLYDSDVADYNFNAHQPIFVSFGRDVAERVWTESEQRGPLWPHRMGPM